ncbi:hypothetical protein OAR97_00745 [Arcobacteraceae bacterium]|nr:hypothetical protein [Arcobacteraceae bacterium]
MSAELLLNFDKNTGKSTVTNDKSIKSLDSTKKIERTSLFDSMMNDAKKAVTLNDVTSENTKKDINNTDREKEILKNSKVEIKLNETTIQNTKESVIKEINNNTVNESKIKVNDSKKVDINQELKSNIDPKIKIDNTHTNEISTSEENEAKDIKSQVNDPKNVSNNTSDESIQKLVDKLVDIVVSAAKDVLTTDQDKPISTNELKNTVEKIVENKITDIIGKDNLQSVINKKLEIVSDSIKVIKNESEVISKNKTITNNQDSIIQKEVSLIKESVNTLQKELSLNDNPGLNDAKSELDITKDSENTIEVKNEIDKNLSVIDMSVDDIKDLLNKEDINNKKNNTSNNHLKDLETKIEYKTLVIEDSVVNIKEKASEIIIVNTLKKENLESLSKIVENTEDIDENLKKPLLAAMFLTAQKVTKDKTSLEQMKDAKNNIIEKKSIDSVKQSAEKLDLNLKDTKVSHEEEKGKKPISKSKTLELNASTLIDNKSLNKALINQKIESELIIKEQTSVVTKDINNVINNQSKKNIEIVEMVVPKEIVPSFQSKIIGAQQKMGTFMNDVARNMYLNYKPPVTAFRVNLNPANLGSISIIMKANKVDNSLSVSMNLSNSNTMEAFSENKVALQSAIQRQFNDSSNVSINFSMEGKSSDNEFTHGNNNQDHNNQNNNQNADAESNNNEEQEIIENNDYM